MAREKRKLHPEKSSRSMWPWLLGGSLVLVLLITGIGLGVLLSRGFKDDPVPIGPIVKNEKENQKENSGGIQQGNRKKGGLGIGSLIEGTTKAKGEWGNGNDSEIFDFIKKNRVYLVPTTAGQSGFTSKDSVLNEDSHLGAFFKALKAHYNDNRVKKTPDKFEAATYSMGPDLEKLSSEKPIPYIPDGGTQVRPVQYDLGSMTALASPLNPAKKPAGIYFEFPRQRQWINIRGKDIESFYLVPLETGRYPALVTVKVAEGIVFDDEIMTARVDPRISEAIKKLLKENNFSNTFMLRAGAPLATWGLAHVNHKETIDFKEAHLEPQKAAAKFKKGKTPRITTFSKWTNDAISNYFPAAQEVAEAKKTNDILKTLQKLQTYTMITARYLKIAESQIPGLDDHKAALTKDAVAIVEGRMTMEAARKTWETKMENMKTADGQAEAVKWDDKQHQQTEWERFKQHRVFYLAGKMGVGNKAVLSLVQFNQ